LLSRGEKRKYKETIRKFKVPEDPIFIIGHWRTGSTFLHQLLNLDDGFSAPTVFQVSVPDNFLVSRRYYKPIISRMIGKVRPMDQVKLGFDEPQEDEYALLKMGINSPLEKLIFPQKNNFFLSGISSLIPGEPDLSRWIDHYQTFYKKISFQTGNRIVFKNPFHSLRIDLLKEIFPKAFFIHIYRNPYVVMPSTRRMWSIVGRQNCLKKYRSDPTIARILEVYKTFHDNIRNSLDRMPEHRYFEIRFEDFEKAPVESLKALYQHMGVKFTEETEKKVYDFLTSNKDYRKNHYALSPGEIALIGEKLSDELQKSGYTNPY
jgi:hypothetical protein